MEKSEIWDVYDTNRNRTGKTVERKNVVLQKGEYHIVVTAIILNEKNEILISKRAPYKRHGGMWECNGGSVVAGETSIEGILREVKEELGIIFRPDEAIYLKEIKKEQEISYFKDLWLFRRNIQNEEITFPDGEATEFMWVSIEEFVDMYNNKKIVPTVDFGKEDYELALKYLKK